MNIGEPLRTIGKTRKSKIFAGMGLETDALLVDELTR
jgi:hypothetical protein